MAIVNKIIHSSVVDGPGNRAAVFLQKCNFKCSYCHNPAVCSMWCMCREVSSQSTFPERRKDCMG